MMPSTEDCNLLHFCMMLSTEESYLISLSYICTENMITCFTFIGCYLSIKDSPFLHFHMMLFTEGSNLIHFPMMPSTEDSRLILLSYIYDIH